MPLLSEAVGLTGDDCVPISSRDMAIAFLISSSSLSVEESDMMTTFDVVEMVVWDCLEDAPWNRDSAEIGATSRAKLAALELYQNQHHNNSFHLEFIYQGSRISFHLIIKIWNCPICLDNGFFTDSTTEQQQSSASTFINFSSTLIPFGPT